MALCVHSGALRAYVEYFERHRWSNHQIADLLGVHAGQVVVDSRINYELWRSALCRLSPLENGSELHLDVGSTLNVSAFGSLQYLLQCRDSAKDAMSDLVKLSGSYNTYATYTLSDNQGLASFQKHLNCPPTETIKSAAVFCFSSLVTKLRFLIGQDWSVKEVRLSCSPPGNQQKYRDFFRCPVSFGCEFDEFLISQSEINRPLATANPALAAAIESFMQSHGLGNSSSFGEQVKGVLRGSLRDPNLSLTGVAGGLGMSSRSLQRKLAIENTTFFEILEQTRKQSAYQYLLTTQLSLKEIADMLGYADVSALQRSCLRWFGKSAGKMRSSFGVR